MIGSIWAWEPVAKKKVYNNDVAKINVTGKPRGVKAYVETWN